jgi:epoxyqueuosine reductase
MLESRPSRKLFEKLKKIDEGMMFRKGQKTKSVDDLSAWIEDTIREFCLNSADNSLRNGENERAFEEPLVGFSNGGDPLYRELQKDIGTPFMTPIEIFEKSFPGVPARADELTVISCILPQIRRTRLDNRKETTYPSERWIRSKHFGAEFAFKLCSYMAETLENAGYEAVVPALASSYSLGISKRYGIASNWSERHAAYVSGLGTFGLCDGLITARGKAIVCYSVIARIPIPPTPRPYTDHHAYCLFYARGTCGLCIKRCPAGAISDHGHDKERCKEHCFGVTLPYANSHFGINEYGCGLCQTGVPCESRNPVLHPSKGMIPI